MASEHKLGCVTEMQFPKRQTNGTCVEVVAYNQERRLGAERYYLLFANNRVPLVRHCVSDSFTTVTSYPMPTSNT